MSRPEPPSTTLSPDALDRRFEAVVLCTDRVATAPGLTRALLALLEAEVHVAVITAAPAATVIDALSRSPASARLLLVAGRHGGDIVAAGLGDVDDLPAGFGSGAAEALRAAGAAAVEQLAELGVEATSSSPSEFDWDVIIEVARRADAEGPDRSDVAALVAHRRVTSRYTLREVATNAALDAGIMDPRVRTDDGSVEISTVDEGDALRWVFAVLWHRGVATSGVLVVADADPEGMRGCSRANLTETLSATIACATSRHRHRHPGTLPLAGGRSAVLRVLRDQARRRVRRAMPVVAPDPGWGMRLDGLDPERERVHGALFVLADGDIGINGSPTVTDRNSRPWVIAAGVYDGDGPETHLLSGPTPTRLEGTLDRDAFRRILDFRSGLVAEVAPTDRGAIETVRFSSMCRPGTIVERITSSDAALDPTPPLSPPEDGSLLDDGWSGPVQWMRVPATRGGIAAAAAVGRHADGSGEVFERFSHFAGDADLLPDPAIPVAGAIAAQRAGFDRLLGEHRARWAERWLDADIVIEGDERLQAEVRFALFHLMGSVRDRDEAAVGARGLTGFGYRGHVFWDADVYVLPFLAATHPASARAMLEYRIRRLPVAMASARALARRGARFPWESARTGVDVTPTSARDRTGRLIPIRTGQLEDHIVADVTWASAFYEEWTGDDEYRRTDGLRLAVATAQYWASRIRISPGGKAHIHGVIGPDEYHEPVDDDAFTNVMARWNLRRAAATVEAIGDDAISPEERLHWLELADALVDGYDSDTGIYEQCAHFFALEPLIIAEVAPRRPIAADYLLGIQRIRQAQIIKQPDVLMLHHLVPEQVARGSLEPNLRFYEPRTSHGSSLSPAIYAALFARARDFDRALEALRIASRIDLDDLTDTTASGLHLATMGGLWHAFAMGFAGLRAGGGQLFVDPLLPRSWSALELHLRFRGSRVIVRRDRAEMTVTAQSPVDVVIDDRAYTVGGRGLVFLRRYDTWELTT